MNTKKIALTLTLASFAGAVIVTAGATHSASADACAPKIYAQASNTTLTGTDCSETFIVGKYSNVTVRAMGGNDTIKVGWGGGLVTVYGGAGNDTVYAGSDKLVVAYGEAGNDTLEGSWFVSGDMLDGGTGNDKGCIQAGDTMKNIESTFLC